MDKVQAITSFWSSFGINAYDENTVPEDASFPRITYNVAVGGFNESESLTASLWYKGTSWANITSKINEIESVLNKGGKMVTFEGGAVWIRPGSPFYNRMPDPDSDIRRIVVNIEVEFIQ